MIRRFLIEGNCNLSGEVSISGSKNSALPCIAASILTNQEINLRNVPDITDVKTMIDILKHLNVNIKRKNDVLTIKAKDPNHEIPGELSSKIRGSTLLLGGLLARTGMVTISQIGGCDIGSRPIDFHLDVFRALGAHVQENNSEIKISASSLSGAKINLPMPSVGATENALIACSLAKGKSTISNAAIEPEILDLIQLLSGLGVKISIENKRLICVHNKEELLGYTHSLIPDRIEAGTFLVAAAITKSQIKINKVNPSHIANVIGVLNKNGVEIEITDDTSISINGCMNLNGFKISTQPYPGFPSDLQPQFSVLATQAISSSMITETLYENRFKHVNALQNMGANIEISGNTLYIDGPTKLSGRTVKALDLRGGAALVLASLVSEGESIVEDIYHIDRGFESFDRKLNEVGAEIERF